VPEHAALFRDPLAAPLPQESEVQQALARLFDARGQTDAARRLRESAGSN